VTGLSAEFLAPLLHTSEVLKDTVSLLGGIYASQNPYLLSLPKTEQKQLFNHWKVLRIFVAATLGASVTSDQFEVALACGLLLNFVEVNEPY
jgi:hypothetical protein